MSRTFVLCDGNIVNSGGHYLEYALRVLAAAEAKGFEPVLIANQAFSGELPRNWRVLRALHFDYWGRDLAPSKSSADFTEIDKWWLKARYSKLGLLWAAAGRLDELQYYSAGFALRASALRWLTRVVRIREGYDLLESVDSSRRASSAATPSTPEERMLRFSRQRATLQTATRLFQSDRSASEQAPRSTFPRDAKAHSALLELTRSSEQAEVFTQDLERAFAELSVPPGSIVLHPTIPLRELSGLGAFLERRGTSPESHHVILRRDVYNGYPGNFDDQEYQAHGMRTALAYLSKQANLFFYTDTPQLADQYNRLGANKFLAGPVPVEKAIAPRQISEPVSDAKTIGLLLRADTLQAATDFLVALSGALPADWTTPIDVRIVSDFITIPQGRTLTSGHPALFCQVLSSRELDDLSVASYDIVGLLASVGEFDRFVYEALDRQIPCIVPFDHWLTSIGHASAPSMHEQYLSSRRPIATASWQDIVWSQYRYSDGNIGRPSTLGGSLQVVADAATTVELSVPKGATQLRIQLETHDALHVTVFGRRSSGADQLGRMDVRLSKGARVTSFVVPVPQDAEKLALALSNYAQSSPMFVSNAELNWYNGAVTPVLPSGPHFCTLGRDVENSYVSPLRYVLDNFSSCREALPYARAHTVSGVSPATRRRVISYFGDARGEKGFNRLPSLLNGLRHSTLATRFILKTQIFYTGDYPEPACVEAAAMLRASRRDDVWIIGQPLDSERYARELQQSDIVLVPYDRQNYVSRSSGIFAEAIAAGVPVVVPAGTWMSAQLDRFAHSMHASIIEWGSVVELEGVDLFELVGSSTKHLGYVRSGSSISVRRSVVTFIHVPIPEHTNHLWVTYTADPRRSDVFVRFDVSFMDGVSDGAEVGKIQRILGGGLCDRHSLIEKVPRNSRSVWVGIYTAFTGEDVCLDNLRVQFASSGTTIPRAPGGVSFNTGDSDEDYTLSLTDAVTHVLTNYECYSAGVKGIQEQWLAENSADTLVRLLDVQDRQPTSKVRFTGNDW